MRSITSILLTFSLIGPFWIASLVLIVKQELIREEVKRSLLEVLDESQMITLSFSKTEAETELAWEHAGEFRYKGQFYDVVKVEDSPDSVSYLCWWDKAETAVVLKLDKLVEDEMAKNGTKNALSNTLRQLLNLPVKGTFEKWSFQRTCEDIQHQSWIADFYTGLAHRPPVPPPRT